MSVLNFLEEVMIHLFWNYRNGKTLQEKTIKLSKKPLFF
jgi:hypothetical protein